MVARAFTAGLALVAVLAVVAIALLRDPAPPDAVTPAFGSDVARVTSGMGPPPTREDLLGAICTGYLATRACEHELMALYRACGADAARPRTPRCSGEVARVRRASQ